MQRDLSIMAWISIDRSFIARENPLENPLINDRHIRIRSPIRRRRLTEFHTVLFVVIYYIRYTGRRTCSVFTRRTVAQGRFSLATGDMAGCNLFVHRFCIRIFCRPTRLSFYSRLIDCVRLLLIRCSHSHPST